MDNQERHLEGPMPYCFAPVVGGKTLTHGLGRPEQVTSVLHHHSSSTNSAVDSSETSASSDDVPLGKHAYSYLRNI